MMLYVLILIFCVAPCNSILDKIVSLPHGDFVYDPDFISGKNGSEQLQTAARQLATTIIQDDEPYDLIFLTTPHGITTESNFIIYANSKLDGYADLGSDTLNNETNTIQHRINNTKNNKNTEETTKTSVNDVNNKNKTHHNERLMINFRQI